MRRGPQPNRSITLHSVTVPKVVGLAALSGSVHLKNSVLDARLRNRTRTAEAKTACQAATHSACTCVDVAVIPRVQTRCLPKMAPFLHVKYVPR